MQPQDLEINTTGSPPGSEDGEVIFKSSQGHSDVEALKNTIGELRTRLEQNEQRHAANQAQQSDMISSLTMPPSNTKLGRINKPSCR